MRLTVFLIAAMALAGCTSMRTMDISQGDIVEQLETGDHLVVYEEGGRVVDMTFSQADESTLYGSEHGNGLASVEVQIDEIVQIEIEKISGAKTTGAIIGGAILIPIFVAGAGVAAVAGSY